jgi:hypothetical protein
MAGSLQKTGGMAEFVSPTRLGWARYLPQLSYLLAGGHFPKVVPQNKKPTGQMLSWRWVSELQLLD